nr:aminotransferase class V-fold PLP-dependent enzyme [Tepidibacter formicigenes]
MYSAYKKNRRNSRKKNIYFHTDAVQAIGKIPIDVRSLNIDMLTISAHKIYGPKGIGALYINENIDIDNFIHGGFQEMKKRAGTQNVSGCVGLGYAIELATSDIENKNKKIEILRDKLINKIQTKIDGVKLNGHPTERLSNNVNVSFENQQH